MENKPKKLRECEKLQNEYLAGWQRCKADFLNYKKEEQEKSKAERGYIEQNCILSMLEVYENLERAVKHISDSGILQIKNQFWELLQSYGLEEIEAIDKQFDPNLHEAVEEVTIENKDTKPGTIIKVVRNGYLLNDKLLIPAKVKVGK